MILKALYDYYHRSEKDAALAPFGLQYKQIEFIIVIDKEGNFIRIEYSPMRKLVAKSNERTGPTSKPYHLWDNFPYVLGISKESIKAGNDNRQLSKKEEKEINKVNREHAAFIK